jgi:hypothetical protein
MLRSFPPNPFHLGETVAVLRATTSANTWPLMGAVNNVAQGRSPEKA